MLHSNRADDVRKARVHVRFDKRVEASPVSEAAILRLNRDDCRSVIVDAAHCVHPDAVSNVNVGFCRLPSKRRRRVWREDVRHPIHPRCLNYCSVVIRGSCKPRRLVINIDHEMT